MAHFDTRHVGDHRQKGYRCDFGGCLSGWHQTIKTAQACEQRELSRQARYAASRKAEAASGGRGY